MGADQRAEIRPVIAELEALPPHDRQKYFARFEVAGDDQLWVEVILGTVNLAYPFTEDPSATFAKVGVEPLGGMVLESWEPNVYATFAHGHENARRCAQFVDDVFERILGVKADYALDVSVAKLAS